MKKVLVTGGTGFVGTAVREALLKECDLEIYVLCRAAKESKDNISFYPCDLMHYQNVNRLMEEIQPEYLIHLAWNVEHTTYLHSSENLLWVGASLNLIKAFAENGGKRIFMCGTCFEYEFENVVLKESSAPLNPATLYASCKGNLQSIAKKYLESMGVSLVWGRLFYLFGENEGATRVVPYAITELLQRKQVICKNATAIRDYMYVGDAGKAIVKTLFSAVEGEINIASGKPVQMGEIFKMIAKLCNAEDKVILQDNPVTPQTVVADVSILQKQVAFNEYTALQDALETSIKWWKGRNL